MIVSIVCSNHLMDFLLVASGLADVQAEDESANIVAATCAQATKVLVALEQFKKADGVEAPQAAPSRFEAMKEYLTRKSSELNGEASKKQSA